MITILKKASLILSVFAVVAFLTTVFAACKEIYEKDIEVEPGESTETETPEDKETPDNGNDDYSGLIDADGYDPTGRFLIAGKVQQEPSDLPVFYCIYNGYYYYYFDTGTFATGSSDPENYVRQVGYVRYSGPVSFQGVNKYITGKIYYIDTW